MNFKKRLLRGEGRMMGELIRRSDILDAIGHDMTYTSQELHDIIMQLPITSIDPLIKKAGKYKYYLRKIKQFCEEAEME